MPMEHEPVVGAVYEDSEGRTFEVREFNEDDGTVKLEYEDGTVDEIDLDAWYDMDAELLETDDEESDEDAGEEYEKDDADELDEDEDDGDFDEEDE